MTSRLPKQLSQMQRAREEREMRQTVQDALMALVKRAGAEGLAIPLEALQDLRAGDSIGIEVLPGQGLLLRHFNERDAKRMQTSGASLTEPEPEPEAS